MKKSIIIFITVASLFLLMGCSGASTQDQSQTNEIGTQPPAQTQSVAPTQEPEPVETQTPTPASAAVGTELQASDAAKAAAEADDSGAPYFVTYEYDAANYLVSSYQTQEGPGNYSGGGDIYLVNKKSGEVLADNQADLSKVDFSKLLSAYSKLSSEIIE